MWPAGAAPMPQPEAYPVSTPPRSCPHCPDGYLAPTADTLSLLCDTCGFGMNAPTPAPPPGYVPSRPGTPPGHDPAELRTPKQTQ